METVKEILVKNLAARLTALHWKQADLAKRTIPLGLTASAVYMICGGKRFPRARQLDILCEATSMRPQDLFHAGGPPPELEKPEFSAKKAWKIMRTLIDKIPGPLLDAMEDWDEKDWDDIADVMDLGVAEKSLQENKELSKK